MTERDQDQLWNAIFADDEVARLRQASLARGLRELRGRRRRTIAARIAMMALPILLLTGLAFYPRNQHRELANTSATILATSKTKPQVEHITTEQLFALFPNRPIALVGKPGHKQLVFLDEQPAGIH